jgi:hypothetical protein
MLNWLKFTLCELRWRRLPQEQQRNGLQGM